VGDDSRQTRIWGDFRDQAGKDDFTFPNPNASVSPAARQQLPVPAPRDTLDLALVAFEGGDTLPFLCPGHSVVCVSRVLSMVFVVVVVVIVVIFLFRPYADGRIEAGGRK
jgi:hypothetical protein